MTSILAADFGSVHTRVVLMDLVDGSYRLTARAYERTTADFPYNNVSVGLARGIGEIASVTGRRLTGTDGKLIVPDPDIVMPFGEELIKEGKLAK